MDDLDQSEEDQEDGEFKSKLAYILWLFYPEYFSCSYFLPGDFVISEGYEMEDDASILDQITAEEMLSAAVKMERFMHSDIVFNR